jgi:hypothetical protein
MLAVSAAEVENETRQRCWPEANAQHRSVAAASDACRDKGKSALPLGLFGHSVGRDYVKKI